MGVHVEFVIGPIIVPKKIWKKGTLEHLFDNVLWNDDNSDNKFNMYIHYLKYDLSI